MNWYYFSNMNRHPGIQGLYSTFWLTSLKLFTLSTLTLALSCAIPDRGWNSLCHHIQNDQENGVSVQCILSKTKEKLHWNIWWILERITVVVLKFLKGFPALKKGWKPVETDKHPRQLLMRRKSYVWQSMCLVQKWKITDQRCVQRSGNFNWFVSCYCDYTSGCEGTGGEVHSTSVDSRTEGKCFFAATDLLQCTESASAFLGHIITGKEIQIYSYDPETKAQSLVWKSPLSPQPKNARQVWCKTNVLLMVPPPPNQVGAEHHEFTSADQTARNIIYNFCGVSVTQYATSNQKSDC